MDAPAVKPPSTALEDFLRKVPLGQENMLQVLSELAEDGTKCKVLSLQNRKLRDELPLAPERAESPRRAHEFHDAAGFAAYIAKYKSENTVVWADVPNQAIHAVLDDKAPKGFETLCLRPAVHPLFDPWQGLLDRSEGEEPMTVREFAEFVMTNRRSVIMPDAKDLVLTLSQVRASKTVTIENGRGNHCLNGVMVETTIQGQLKNELIAMPESLTLNCPIFVRTSPLQIEIDLLAVEIGGAVYMRAVSADVATAKVEAFDEMLLACRKIEGVVVATGRPMERAWEYLR